MKQPQQQPRNLNERELEGLMNMTNAEKVGWIREQLNLIYPGEFSLSVVTKRVEGLTYQGLRFTEVSGKAPRLITLERLTEVYNVPLDIFQKNVVLTHLFLGKKEDQARLESMKPVEEIIKDDMTFGEKFNAARKMAGLSLQEMSDGLGFTVKRLIEIERGI